MSGLHLRTLRIVLAALLFSTPAFTQSPRAPKDDAAMTVLSQMAAVTGWTRANAPIDVMATGTITRHRGEQQDTFPIALKVKGGRKSRTEIQDGSFLLTSIVNGNRAAALTPEGTRHIPSHVAAARRPMEFPFLTDLSAPWDDDVSLSYQGTEEVRGESTHRIEIVREPPADYPLRKYKRRTVGLTVWISTVSGLPVQIQYNHVAFNNPHAFLPATRYFSDYRVVGGLAVPFYQEESVRGQRLRTLQLVDVQFNLGLSDFEFEVPDEQR